MAEHISMADIYTQDRFILRYPWRVVWMYHNPDATSGDQFVENCIGSELLAEALRECGKDVDKVFDYIGENCTQYLTDKGDYCYDEVKERFEGEAIAVGLTKKTINKMKKLLGVQ